MRCLRLINVVVLAVIGITSIPIIVGDFFHIWNPLGHVPYPTICAVFLALISIHLVAMHVDHSTWQNDQTEILKKVAQRIGSPSVMAFENSAELESHLAVRIKDAKTEICDLSWKLRISAGFGVGKRKDSHRSYESSITSAARDIQYREIFVFNDPRRVDKLRRRIAENREGYSCRYFENETIPRLQFIIIDNREIIFFAASPGALLCGIESPEICRVFRPYFDELWNAAIPIKDGAVTHKEVVERIVKVASECGPPTAPAPSSASTPSTTAQTPTGGNRPT